MLTILNVGRGIRFTRQDAMQMEQKKYINDARWETDEFLVEHFFDALSKKRNHIQTILKFSTLGISE